jgi:hypothetical protein
MLLLFLLPALGFAAATSASAATGDSSSDTRGGGERWTRCQWWTRTSMRSRCCWTTSTTPTRTRWMTRTPSGAAARPRPPGGASPPRPRPAASAYCPPLPSPSRTAAAPSPSPPTGVHDDVRAALASSREWQMASRSEAENDPLDVCRRGGGWLLPHWPRRCSMSRKNLHTERACRHQ